MRYASALEVVCLRLPLLHAALGSAGLHGEGLLQHRAPAGALTLEPANPPVLQAFRDANFPSWGGSIIRGSAGDRHSHHLFAAAFTRGCGLDGWVTNSVVIHAVASNASGPFVFHDIALPIYHCNPQIVQHTDGTYLLFAAGAINASLELPCNATTGRPIGSGPAGPWTKTAMYTSHSLYGPWALHKPPQPKAFQVLQRVNAVTGVAKVPKANESMVTYLGLYASASACRDSVRLAVLAGTFFSAFAWFDGSAGTTNYKHQCYGAK
jgi:hypothetical protein